MKAVFSFMIGVCLRIPRLHIAAHICRLWTSIQLGPGFLAFSMIYILYIQSLVDRTQPLHSRQTMLCYQEDLVVKTGQSRLACSLMARKILRAIKASWHISTRAERHSVLNLFIPGGKISEYGICLLEDVLPQGSSLTDLLHTSSDLFTILSPKSESASLYDSLGFG